MLQHGVCFLQITSGRVPLHHLLQYLAHVSIGKCLHLVRWHRVEASGLQEGLSNHQVVQAELARGLRLKHLRLLRVEALLAHSLHHLQMLVAILLLLIDHDLSLTKVVLVLIFVAILVDLVDVLVKLQVTHAVH